jgi:hypothetical protein
MKRILLLSIVPLLMFQASLFAQNEKVSLAGRHTLFIESGFKSNSTTSVVVTSGTVETKAGFIGGINYGYWFDEQWGLTLSVGLFGAETSTKFNGVETSAIIPVLFGIRFYPEGLSLGSVGRPYAGLSLGQYLGFATKVKNLFTTETVSEPIFGGEVSAGVDLFVASWFKIGPKFSYHFLGDYSEVIGAKKNLSGASFSVEFGFVF